MEAGVRNPKDVEKASKNNGSRRAEIALGRGKTMDLSDVLGLHQGGIEMRPDHVSTSTSTDGKWAP